MKFIFITQFFNNFRRNFLNTIFMEIPRCMLITSSSLNIHRRAILLPRLRPRRGELLQPRRLAPVVRDNTRGGGLRALCRPRQTPSRTNHRRLLFSSTQADLRKRGGRGRRLDGVVLHGDQGSESGHPAPPIRGPMMKI